MSGGSPLSLAGPAGRAAQRIRSAEYVRIVAACTPDALAAAAVLHFALGRETIDCHVSLANDLGPFPFERVAGEDLVVLVDGWGDGSRWTGPDFASLSERAILLEHDRARAAPPAAVHLNPSMGAHDGACECTASSLAYLVATSLDRRNTDLAVLALAGGLAERQPMAGLHASLRVEGEAAAVLRSEAPFGSASVGTFLAGPEPFLRGVGGRARAAQRLARDWGFDPASAIASLDEGSRSSFSSRLVRALLEQGCRPSAVDSVLLPDIIATTGPLSGWSGRALASAFAQGCASGNEGPTLAATLSRNLSPQSAGSMTGFDPLPTLLRAEREPEPPEGCPLLVEAPPGTSAFVAGVASAFLSRGRPVLAWEKAPAAVPGPAGAHVGFAYGSPLESKGDADAALQAVLDSALQASDGAKSAAAEKVQAAVAGHRLFARARVGIPSAIDIGAALRQAVAAS